MGGGALHPRLCKTTGLLVAPWGCWWAGFKMHRRKGMKDEAGQISKRRPDFMSHSTSQPKVKDFNESD